MQGASGLGIRIPLLLMVLVLATVSCAAPKEKTILNVYNKPADVSSAETSGALGGASSESQTSKFPVTAGQMTLIPPIPDNSSVNQILPDLKNRFSPDEEVTVSVDTLSLSDFVHYVFKELLNVNYILDSKVPAQEKLSLNLQDRVSKQKLYAIVSDILAGYGTVIREKSGVYYIVAGTPQQGVSVGVGSALGDVPETTGQIRQLVPLRYVLPLNMSQMLANMSGVVVYPMPNENLLVVQGLRDSIIQTLQLIEALDRPAMRGKFGVMFKLSYWNPQDLVVKLKDILSQEGIPVSMNASDAGLRLISIDRWRILLAFAAEKEWVDRLSYWVKTIDIPEDKVDKQFFIYFPENSRASDLYDTLQNILGLSSGGYKSTGKTGSQKSAMTKPGSQFGQASQFGIGQSSMRAAASSSEVTPPHIDSTPEETGTGADRISPSLAAIAGQVSATVDDNRNALVLYTTQMYYKSIESLLRRIDLMPAQVLIEASVVQVELTGSLTYGVEWYLTSVSGNTTNQLSVLSGTTGSAGFSYSLVNTSANPFKVLVNALGSDSRIKVLSSPRLMVRDGKTANMVVGTEVPYPASELAAASTSSASPSVIRTWEYLTTGITLSVTPTVHSRGILTLTIMQGVSQAEPVDSSGNPPRIDNRNVSTDVVAADGQTVILGGLISENETASHTNVPWLSDIPVLGNLFKNTTKEHDRTEMIVMITPHVIRSPQQADDMRAAILHNFEEIEIKDNISPKID